MYYACEAHVSLFAYAEKNYDTAPAAIKFTTMHPSDKARIWLDSSHNSPVYLCAYTYYYLACVYAIKAIKVADDVALFAYYATHKIWHALNHKVTTELIIIFVLFFSLFVGSAVPRNRSQYEHFGWKFMIPFQW